MCQHKSNRFSTLSSGSSKLTGNKADIIKLPLHFQYQRPGHCQAKLNASMHTFVQVVVFPLPWRPTNMMTFFLPLVGCQAFTPGSISCKFHWKYVPQGNKLYRTLAESCTLTSSLNTADWIIRRLLRPAAISSKSMTDLQG